MSSAPGAAAAPHAAPPLIVVMGVSGSGKTTIATALALRLSRPMLDADDLHPPANRDKLSAGIPLTDADRAPWLDAVAGWIMQHRMRGESVVVACSALKRRYRERLRQAEPAACFVHLDLDRATLGQRVTHRVGHFMPASLLDDQLATLEPPQADEPALRVTPVGAVDDTVDAIVAALSGLAQAGRMG